MKRRRRAKRTNQNLKPERLDAVTGGGGSQNDAIGTRDYSIDCITGSSTIRGGSLSGQQQDT